MIRNFRLCTMCILLSGSAAATAMLLANAHEMLRASGPGAIAFLLCAIGCAVLRFGCSHPISEPRRIVRDFAEYAGFFGLLCMIGAIASYPDAAASSGMADPMLEHADRLLHFDWVRVYQFVADHRSLQILGALAYQSIYLTPAVLLGYFAWASRGTDAHRFLWSFWLAAVITLVLFRWLPAAGPFAYLWHGPIPYMPQSALYQARLIPILQNHQLPMIDVDALHGLVSAPSFHAASAMLYIAFATRVPRRIGIPLIVLNLAMIAATPVEGTHYLIDIVSGIFVALIALTVVTALSSRPLASRAGSPAMQA